MINQASCDYCNVNFSVTHFHRELLRNVVSRENLRRTTIGRTEREVEKRNATETVVGTGPVIVDTGADLGLKASPGILGMYF